MVNKALINRAMCGCKADRRDFCNYIWYCMQCLGFTSCPADLDLWMKPSKKSYGLVFYKYALLYNNSVLVVRENEEQLLRDKIGKYLK